ncbi:MAG: acetamidase/formamidase family protein [Actinobacteria bacterium]|nr:acetamidase/formamidase family protein [Actinomycetota bacterium]
MAHHRYTPTQYHVAIGSHAPVLRVASGDTISTTTVDAAGGDASGAVVTAPGNPQTGPFYVEGAEAGDTLSVKLDRLHPNRDTGFSSAALAANVLDFGYQPGFGDDVGRATWRVDTAAQTVTLIGPQNRLTGKPLPLRCMVGCFGVAPARGQAISTATSGEHGGNMDYNGFVEGVTVYFPVLVPGALFHIGDGHALQGDGEMDGTGVEVSMDVTFTLELIKQRTIGWPRAENATHLITVGNARPLDQCVQHATTEMVRWLVAGYGLTAREAHMLLGRLVRYELGNMFDPAYTMVCKVAKADVARLRS